MKTQILYISGLGDSYDGFRNMCLKAWRILGVETRLVTSKWNNGERYEAKIRNVLNEISRAHGAGARIVLIGESAGATLALIAGQDRRVSRTITLCGVTDPNMPIAKKIRQRSPAFVEAVSALRSVKLEGVVSVRGAVDLTVKKDYSVWPESQEKVVVGVGHLLTIILCLTVYSPWLIRVSKK